MIIKENEKRVALLRAFHLVQETCQQYEEEVDNYVADAVDANVVVAGTIDADGTGSDSTETA